MKFFIKGALENKEPEELRNRFKEYCRKLGAALAKGGHTIILGCYEGKEPDAKIDYITVGPYILMGANEVTGKHKVILFSVEEEEDIKKFKDDSNNWTNIDFSTRAVEEEWKEAMIPAIQEADGIVLIGGYANTGVIGYGSRVAKKPVLAIPVFKGTAKELWKFLRDDYEQAGISSEEIELLKTDEIDNQADKIIQIAEKLVKNHPSLKSIWQAAMLIGVLGLTGLWIALFVDAFNLIRDVSFFLLLGISALLGTGLRNSMNLMTGQKNQFTTRELLNDITTSILLAFGFSLLYLAGVIVLTGKVISITGQEDFTRISVSMALLGFSAALLLDQAYKIIKNRLETVLTK